METAYHVLYLAGVIVATVLAGFALARCIIGPRISDRLLGVNMIGTLTIIAVCIFVDDLSEGYLADVALVYAMLSFLAVVVLCKVYTGIYREKKHEEEKLAAEKARD